MQFYIPEVVSVEQVLVSWEIQFQFPKIFVNQVLFCQVFPLGLHVICFVQKLLSNALFTPRIHVKLNQIYQENLIQEQKADWSALTSISSMRHLLMCTKFLVHKTKHTKQLLWRKKKPRSTKQLLNRSNFDANGRGIKPWATIFLG